MYVLEPRVALNTCTSQPKSTKTITEERKMQIERQIKIFILTKHNENSK